MMTERTVGEQIEVMMPRSINDVIRLNKDKASLRFSTKEDLEALASEILRSGRVVPVSLWNFITLSSGEKQHVFLFGWNDDEGCTWNTSPVQAFDSRAGLIVTRSGTIYNLSGPQGAEQDLDLVHLCVYLRKTGAGDFYGIPPFFY